jgi:hypothetical protein
MKHLCAFTLVVTLATSALGQSANTIPLVIELFTSEGCSSCPPADRLLAELDRQQPVAGAQLIVLSEHVDYWNTQGWIDPYSSHEFTERQERYGAALRVADVYTPQAVIDGRLEVVGNSSSKVQAAIQEALRARKIPLRLEATRGENGIRAQLQVGGELSRGAEIYFAVAEDAVASKVSAGENSGRVLTHTAVVRSLTKSGRPASDKRVDAQLKTSPRWGKHLRVIAFVAEHEGGKIIAAAVVDNV